jgi:hypothetical protein
MISFLPSIFLSAFLLFQIQPIIARYILPWYGGSPTIWTSCMMFFQVALLLGYLYAHLLASYVPPKRQATLHLTLLVLSLILLPIGIPESWTPATAGEPAIEILALLSLSVGIPFVLISASGPLLQHWFSGVYPGKSPFRLYALSNFGSLAALLSYPVLIEPNFTIDNQAVTWSILYFALILLFASCGFLYSKSNSENLTADTDPATVKPVSGLDRVLWVALAACGSTMLLAITNEISTDVAVVPFMWVLPLSIYLTTFIICFDKDGWYKRGVWMSLLLVSLVLLTRIMFTEFTGESVSLAYEIFVLCFALFTCCMVCHGELARRRSAVPHLTTFYLYVALGGAIGGVFVNIFAPILFTGFWELHVGLVGTVILAGVCINIDKSLVKTRQRLAVAASIWSIATIAFIGILTAQVQSGREDSIYVERSFFGVLYVDEYHANTARHERQLFHGRIQHGRQLLNSLAVRIPTSYFGKDTGVAAAIENHPKRSAADPADRGLKIGIIGLGAGTISTYGTSADSVRYYEIDPNVEHVAREYFFYLENSEAETEVVLGDARISMQRELNDEGSNEFDVFVIDAFSGDAIPAHLVTDEAFDLYEEHLRDDGILAVHITNDYIDLSPLIRTTAKRLGKSAIWIEGDADLWYADYNDWVLVTNNRQFLNSHKLREMQEIWPDSEFKPIRWTDDFSNLYELIDWSD